MLLTMHETTIVPVADEHGHITHYPGEEDDVRYKRQLLRRESRISKLWTSFWNDNTMTMKFLEGLKCAFSMTILLTSIYTVIVAMIAKQTVATHAGLPIILGVIFFAYLIFWLAAMEGEQACLVGLQPIQKKRYQHSHPLTYVSTVIAHKGDNMERYIVGRQFLVCLVVFASNLIAATIDNAIVPTLSETIVSSMLSSGSAVTLIAIIIGQSAQINAANCMLDFINNHFMIMTTYLSLLLDMSGLLHSVYLFQTLFTKITNTPIQSDEEPRTAFQHITYIIRMIFSTSILLLSFLVTIAAIWNNETTMYAGVPRIVSILLLFFLLTFVGILEGMQIALFAVVNLPKQDIKQYKYASKCCQLTFQGSNLQAFLIGRQLCVTMCMFVVARLTSCNVELTDPNHTIHDNIFGVNDSIQALFNTGMLGAFITTVIGSLVWRILASCFPVLFLSNPIVYWIIQLCLIVEVSGVCSAAWPLALIQKRYIFGYKLDEHYLDGNKQEEEAAQEEAAQEQQDVEQQQQDSSTDTIATITANECTPLKPSSSTSSSSTMTSSTTTTTSF